jgi:hypothetical protein
LGAAVRNPKLFSLIALSLITFTLPAHASAAQNTPGGISLSPFLQQITIKPADADKSFTLTLSNHTSSLQELSLKAQDFGSLNDTGGVLLEGSNDNTRKYGLTSWLTLGTDTVVLPAHQSKDIAVTILNRDSLQPGGHYGAVVASVNSLDKATGNHVAINQQLLSLILVDKVGGEHYDLKLSSIGHDGNWLHLPHTVRLQFQNPGNVHVVPRGTVKLKNPAGKVLAQGLINTESAYILPESYRQMYVPLTSVAKQLPLPGTYRIEVSYRYDGLPNYAVKTQNVGFVDLKLYAILAVIGLAAVVLWKRRKNTFKRRAN